MAAQTKKSILGSMYGMGGDIAKEIAADNSLPSAGIQDPPPGIKNGVCQVEEVKFELYKTGKNEGKPYFVGNAIILEPTEHTYQPTSKKQAIDGVGPKRVVTAGMRTRITVDIFDKKIESGPKMGQITPMKDGAMKAAQIMRSLGADTSRLRSLTDLEDLAEALTKHARNPNSPIYVRFSTSIREAQNIGEEDGCWQNWNGTAGLEDYTPPSGAQGVADATVEEPEGDTGDTRAEDSAGGDLSAMDLDVLVEQARGEEGKSVTPAIDELLRRASEVSGRTPEKIEEEVNSIDDVVALINGGDAGDEAEPEAAPEPPKKGDKVHYKAPVKKMGKMVPGKAVECNVESINATKGTVTLKNMIDGRTLYKDVPLDQIEDIA